MVFSAVVFWVAFLYRQVGSYLQMSITTGLTDNKETVTNLFIVAVFIGQLD